MLNRSNVLTALVLLIIQPLLIVGFTTRAHAETYTSTTIEITHRCTADRVNGGHVCANVYLYAEGTSIRDEGEALRSELNVSPTRCVTYLGWSSKNLSNGGSRRVVVSERKPSRFHLYRVTPRSQRCAPYQPGA